VVADGGVEKHLLRTLWRCVARRPRDGLPTPAGRIAVSAVCWARPGREVAPSRAMGRAPGTGPGVTMVETAGQLAA